MTDKKIEPWIMEAVKSIQRHLMNGPLVESDLDAVASIIARHALQQPEPVADAEIERMLSHATSYGHEKQNMLPGSEHPSWDARIVPAEDLEKLLSTIRSLLAQREELARALVSIVEPLSEEETPEALMSMLCDGDLDYGQLRDLVYDANVIARTALAKVRK